MTKACYRFQNRNHKQVLLYHQPKQCSITEILQNYEQHFSMKFDPLKNRWHLMTPDKSWTKTGKSLISVAAYDMFGCLIVPLQKKSLGKNVLKKDVLLLAFINDSRPIKSWNLLKTHKIHLLRPGQPLPTTPFWNAKCNQLASPFSTKNPDVQGKWTDFCLIPGRSWNKPFPVDELSSSIPTQKKGLEISLSKILKAVSCWDPLQMA